MKKVELCGSCNKGLKIALARTETLFALLIFGNVTANNCFMYDRRFENQYCYKNVKMCQSQR